MLSSEKSWGLFVPVFIFQGIGAGFEFGFQLLLEFIRVPFFLPHLLFVNIHLVTDFLLFFFGSCFVVLFHHAAVFPGHLLSRGMTATAQYEERQDCNQNVQAGLRHKSRW